MDFTFTEEQKQLRQQVRNFLLSEMPPALAEWGGGLEIASSPPEVFAQARSFEKRLAESGWLTVGWPKQYGGGGFGLIEQAIVNEEKGYWRIPTVNSVGLGFAGPALMLHGTDAQKQQYLPSIARGEVIWAQGFTEPGAGSDLASLQTRAVQDGDEFVINGQKIFTSHAHICDYFYLAVRTDPDAPKHRGISLLIVPNGLPGITVRPLWLAHGSRSSRNNEVFFDDVRVPVSSIVGERNRGWYTMATTLDFERSGVAGVAGHRRDYDDLVRYCQETTLHGQRLIDVPRVRSILAEMSVRLEVLTMLCWRVTWMQSRGLVPNAEASVQSLFNKEFTSWFSRQGMALLGAYGQLTGSRWAPLAGRFADGYVAAQSVHAGGHANIQRNIIATRGLGLPR